MNSNNWAVYEYKIKPGIRFYTYSNLTFHPMVEKSIMFIGYASTREGAVDLIWKDRKKPVPSQE